KMCTTAGIDAAAASAWEARALSAVPPLPEAASRTVTTVWGDGAGPNQPGVSVSSTNSAATVTVTACAKINQKRYMQRIRNDCSVGRAGLQPPVSSGAERCRGGRMRLNELREYVDGLLDVPSFRDYCPNGLQVEG